MQANTHSPMNLFGLHVRYVVPLFQRPYVWDEAKQWGPLWEDVRALAERLQEAGKPPAWGPSPVAPHFLGAIVLDQVMNPSGFISVRHVVDGQQRLTTLQLLLDAIQEVVEQHGDTADATGLQALVLNPSAVAASQDERFKVWPTTRDRAAFRAAMDNEMVVPAELHTSQIVKAHTFFKETTCDWADVTGDSDKATARLSALTRAVRDHLKMVVIDLEPGDNAQVIFETLNHRGAPLLAADLVKNLVFRIAEAKGVDLEELYAKHWEQFDGDHWRQVITQGRLYRPRIDVFFNYWLTMHLVREVPTDRIYTEFRDQLLHGPDPDLSGILKELAHDADVYRRLDTLPWNSAAAIFRYRVLQALDSGAVTPFLLWVMRWPESDMPSDQRDRALRSVESWIVRRALCRLTAKNINQVVLELLRRLAEAGPAMAGETTEQFLSRQTADARLWPDDDMVTSALAAEPIYRNLVRARVRMVLEALEDDLRTPKAEQDRCPRNLTIEHVMPQAWSEHWGSDIAGDDAGAVRRDRLVHTLGNLTLVSKKLNPSLSNRPWTSRESKSRGLGQTGKRAALLEHSNLKLNAKLVSSHEAAWTEDAITVRTGELTKRLFMIWPRVGAPLPLAAAPMERDKPADYIDQSPEGQAGKYEPLSLWLSSQQSSRLAMSFDDVETILGFELPPSARNHLPYWYGHAGSALCRAIHGAGWKATGVNLTAETAGFIRDGQV
jgi:hypothetical protein